MTDNADHGDITGPAPPPAPMCGGGKRKKSKSKKSKPKRGKPKRSKPKRGSKRR